MITINGKTYKQKYFSGIYPIEEQLLKWIVEGLLEEVKEKPLSQKRAEAIERGKQHSTEYYSALSILEKLREDLEERIKEYKGKLSTKKITKQTTQDKILLIRINELEVVLIVLTSLSSEEQPEDPKGKIYREWVEKEKKHFFEQYKDLLPEEQPQFTPGQEEPETVSDKNMIRINKYDFTPGQEIEVSNDGERWYKKEFTHTGRGIALADKTIYFYTTGLDPEYNDGRKLGEGWKFARPIEDKIEPELPEFNWDWVMKQLEENQKLNLIPFTALAVMATHIGVMDKALARQKSTK